MGSRQTEKRASGSAVVSDRLESLIQYTGESDIERETFDVDLFKSLNEEYASKPVVPAARAHSIDYGIEVGGRRGTMLDRKIGLRDRRVLEIGCGAGALSHVLAENFGCDMIGVDVTRYPEWDELNRGRMDLRVHDITTQDNTSLGFFDRVVSFAVFEHIVHPHSGLKAAYDMLEPGGKAYIYANLYRGAKASHRYREVFFPWPHLLFEQPVWREFYQNNHDEVLEAAWVNKLTYDQYVNFAERIGFEVTEHFPSAPFFDEAFYKRFEYRLAAYPKFDLMHDFIHLILQKPERDLSYGSGDHGAAHGQEEALLNHPPQRGQGLEDYGNSFWEKARERRDWLPHKKAWYKSRQKSASALRDKVPWVTFPAIDYLKNRLTGSERVFEWGSGGSTLFFQEHAGSLVSIEHDRGWYDAVKAPLGNSRPSGDFLHLLHAPREDAGPDPRYRSGSPHHAGLSFEAYVREIENYQDEVFDLVVVDGRARMDCLEAAVRKVAPGGALLLDNANYPRYQSQLDRLRRDLFADWNEVSLAGPGPYSKTPCWETVVWEHPATSVDRPHHRKEMPLRTSPEMAMAVRRDLKRGKCRSYDLIGYLQDEIVDAARSSIADNGSYELFGNVFGISSDDSVILENGNRTGDLLIQSWGHLEPFLSGEMLHARKHESFVLRQVEEFHVNSGKVVSRPTDGEEFDTYDTAVSDRFYRLAYLLNAVSGSDAASDELFTRLLNSLVGHLDFLCDAENLSWQHNHAFYQVMALLCGTSRFANLPSPEGKQLSRRMRVAHRTALTWLEDLIAAHFGADGFHKEHSPFYHVSLINSLFWMVKNGVIADATLTRSIRRLSKAAELFFDASGRIANFGDTDGEISLRVPGKPVSGDVKAVLAAEAGYWFVRGGEDTYLAQSCAFHSRTHKQADSGTLIWRDRECDILIDSGRYAYEGRSQANDPLFRDGFWYSDPKRVHVESSRAHNTIEIDGCNHRRFRQAVLGGTITSHVKRDGIFASRCVIPNAGRIQHQRFTVLRPGHWLIVFDTCRFPDGPHTARQWFQLHPDWTELERTEREQSGILSFANGDQRLQVQPLLGSADIEGPFRGDMVEPYNETDSGYRGWWSPQASVLKPSNAFALKGISPFVTLGTLLSLDPINPESAKSHINATHRSIRISWRNEHELCNLNLTSEGLRQSEFDVAFTVGAL